MEDLSLVSDKELQLKPGDFAARVDRGRLLVPPVLLTVLRSLGVFTAVQLMSYLAVSSSVITSLLHWRKADLDRALATLTRSLRGVVDESAFRKPARRRSTGALTGRSTKPGSRTYTPDGNAKQA